jgi:hypothetical protein
MATLTKAEAARQLGISRTTLYKLIDQGMLSATPEGLIDTAELVRVMSTLHVHPAVHGHSRTLDHWTPFQAGVNTVNVHLICPVNTRYRRPVNVN